MRSFRGFSLLFLPILLAALSCTFLQTQAISTDEPVPPLPTGTPTAGQKYPAEGCPQYQGKIVFGYDDSALDTLTDLWLMSPNGADPAQLGSPKPGRQNEPAWSPEHCRIAFTDFTDLGDEDIYLLYPASGEITKLTSDPARNMMPDWSPDGTRLVYVSFDTGGIRNLWVMNADGSDPRQITFNCSEFSQWPQWSPTGEWIAYTDDNSCKPRYGGRVRLVAPDGTQDHQLTPDVGALGDMDAAWSPDGKTVYFLSNRSSMVEIWSIQIDGSGLKQITHLGQITPSHSLRVSPDGKQLAFYGVGPGVESNGQELFILNVDGSEIHNVPSSQGDEEWFDW